MYFAGDPLNDVDLIWNDLTPAQRGLVTAAFTAEEGATPAGHIDLVLRKA